MTEPSLKKDSLGKNIQYTGVNATIRQIYHLILMKPNTDPLNPEKGCDARSYYFQIKNDNTVSSLETKIKEQIAAYTPYNPANVMCKAIKNKYGKWILHIMISIYGNKTIIVSTNGERSTLNLLDK